MRIRNLNRVVQGVMVAVLAATGWPLVQPLLPDNEPARPVLPHEQQSIPGQLVVDAKDSLTPAELQTLNQRYGLNLQFNSPESKDDKLLVTNVAPGQEEAVLAKLRSESLVETAGPMYRYALPPEELLGTIGRFDLAADDADPARSAGKAARERSRSGGEWTPDDPRFGEQWNMKLIGAEQAWGKGAAGKGVVVAVIDTGVAFENDDKRCYQAKDFKGTRFVPGYDFVNNDAHPNDDHGHGTHVAGTVAETTNNGEGVAGLAYEASIMPLKVLDFGGSGSTADIADAIRFAADHGARIINMSLGGPFPDRVMENACKYAAKKGVLIVCAAGNSSGGPVGYPAAFKECMAVSSVGPTGELAFYSSYGKQVAIAGPGGDKTKGEQDGVLQNTVLDGDPKTDNYYSFQGTSMASPHVAAAAALVMGRGVTDPGEVRQILQKSARPKKPQNKYGAGILSAADAVAQADGAVRNSWLRLLFTLIAGFTGLGVGMIRDKARGLLRFPYAPLGFFIGALAPDLIFGWMGFGSPFNIILHSALVPLYLLWEAEASATRKFVAAVALGVAGHLAWDALGGVAPFSGVLPQHGIPWLWVNMIVGLGVALVAWRRSLRTE